MLTYERSGKAMKKDIRKDIFTIIAVTVAAFLMALNTKTFVNTGGLYPGGMTNSKYKGRHFFVLVTC